jgi:hypothetical protein
MMPETPLKLSSRMEVAIEEIQQLVRQRFPEATFEVGHGEDPEGVHLIATVDLDDLQEVIDLYLDRLVDMQIDEMLPLYVIPVRPLERSLEMLRKEQASAN